MRSSTSFHTGKVGNTKKRRGTKEIEHREKKRVETMCAILWGTLPEDLGESSNTAPKKSNPNQNKT